MPQTAGPSPIALAAAAAAPAGRLRTTIGDLRAQAYAQVGRIDRLINLHSSDTAEANVYVVLRNLSSIALKAATLTLVRAVKARAAEQPGGREWAGHRLKLLRVEVVLGSYMPATRESPIPRQTGRSGQIFVTGLLKTTVLRGWSRRLMCGFRRRYQFFRTSSRSMIRTCKGQRLGIAQLFEPLGQIDQLVKLFGPLSHCCVVV